MLDSNKIYYDTIEDYCPSDPESRFKDAGLKVMQSRYLQEGETPTEMFKRVAKALAEVDARYVYPETSVKQWEREFYEVMAQFKFTPAGRTLANAGTPRKLISNCVVLHIYDSMDCIFSTLKDAAILQQAGCGLGFPLHLLRPAGFPCSRTQGTASGPISFLNVYDRSFSVIKQQNRHGANMAVMKVDHPDILEFIHCKDKEGDISNFNISVGITNEFMLHVTEDKYSTTPWKCKWAGQEISPRRIKRNKKFAFIGAAPEPTMTARAIWREICQSAWKTGEPGVVFLDTVNETNPLRFIGDIECCNPCGEQFLQDGDVCNLGAINLAEMVKTTILSANCGKTTTQVNVFDWDELERVTRLAVRMLDNVIDITDFDVKKVQDTIRQNRRIGLGLMGFADLLFKLGIPYNSEEARKLATEIMQTMTTVGRAQSAMIATRKGRFPNWHKSSFPGENQIQRNAAITTVAPTGTISLMFGVSGGIEPYFALAYHYKGVLDGKTQIKCELHPELLRALAEAGLSDREDLIKQIEFDGTLKNIPDIPRWIREVFVTSMDISAEDHILMQAAFQQHCDNAISKTINFPTSACVSDIDMGFRMAWEHRCKGCTVYRDGSRNFQILNLNSSGNSNETCPFCSDSPTLTVSKEGCTACANCGYTKCSL